MYRVILEFSMVYYVYDTRKDSALYFVVTLY